MQRSVRSNPSLHARHLYISPLSLPPPFLSSSSPPSLPLLPLPFLPSLPPCLPLGVVYLQAGRACYDGNFRQQAAHLLQAHQWDHAHSVIIDHLATDDIISGGCVCIHAYVRACVKTLGSFYTYMYMYIIKKQPHSTSPLCLHQVIRHLSITC